MKLYNSIQAYSWGSTKIISHLLGNKEANNPQAELWMGAHPKASSKLSWMVNLFLLMILSEGCQSIY